MANRVDKASRMIDAPASTLYDAFATAEAITTWLPPPGMTASMLAFAFREGGGYRMRLTYDEPQGNRGKTTEDADEVEVRFIRLVPGRRIEQAATFESDDPAFAGEMRMTWEFEASRDRTLVTVRCENVPSGIEAGVHEAALQSSLGNLARFAERAANRE